MENVLEHLIDRYDELFEACFAGDNDKIQGLCLPLENQNAKIGLGQNSTPLNISVRMVDGSISRYDDKGATFRYIDAREPSSLNRKYIGYTPLFAAITARRWAIAKFILAVATAQYHPDDEEDEVKFDLDIDTGASTLLIVDVN
jgi:hypothetical protein